MATITIAYSNHRPEALAYTASAMRRHPVVFLEEAPDPAFGAMLSGRLAIDAYVAELDTEYPEFSRLSCRMMRVLNSEGIRFEQVEPFVQRLLQVHDGFASGLTPEDIMGDGLLMPVYAAEKEATRTLIDFYASAAGQPFEDVLAALKAFAVADAMRFRLRDRLRADALALRLGHFPSCYIEAGTMHLWLRRCIKHRLGGIHDIHSLYPMAAAVKAVTGRSYLMGPGDDLTVIYIFNPRADSPRVDLLAARSLIFNKILIKTEILSANDTCPHTRDEWQALKKVNRMQRSDCETLFEQIRGVGTSQANSIVDAYLEKEMA
jgi:hypothetical protein